MLAKGFNTFFGHFRPGNRLVLGHLVKKDHSQLGYKSIGLQLFLVNWATGQSGYRSIGLQVYYLCIVSSDRRLVRGTQCPEIH